MRSPDLIIGNREKEEEKEEEKKEKTFRKLLDFYVVCLVQLADWW